MKNFECIPSGQKLLAALCLLILSIFVSCNKDPSPGVQFNTPQLDLHYDQQHQFTISEDAAGLDPHTFSWSSEDQTVGTIEADGKFTARKVGKTIVRAVSADGKMSIAGNVTVTPYSLLFTEPVILWGASQTQVQTAEKRKALENTPYYLSFNGETSLIKKAEYYFSPDRKLSSANIFLENDSQTYQQAVLYLKERYPDGYTSYNSVDPFQLIYYFIADDKKTRIYFSKTEIGNLVSYQTAE